MARKSKKDKEHKKKEAPVMPEKSELLTPPKINTGAAGRPSIDFDELYKTWRSTVDYIDIPSFLALYGIDYRQRIPRTKTRDWRRREVSLRIETVERFSWEKVVEWRSKQFQEDYRVSTKIRNLVEQKTEELSDRHEAGANIRTIDLLNLAKAAETLQRVQRLSLGLSTDNVGVEDGKHGPSEDETPTFVVEMNEDGKFKTQRPRQVIGKLEN